MQKERRTLTEQLEPMAWRTTQREQQKGYEHAATIEKWADIIAAIMDFQNKWEGHSPSNHAIAKAVTLSPGQVDYHLKRMQERGLIYDDGSWPRNITIYAAKVQDQQQALALSEAPKQEAKQEEAVAVESQNIGGKSKLDRKNFLDRAREFAQHLTDHYDRHGRAPLLKDVAKLMGYSQGGLSKSGARRSTTGGLSHVVTEMTRRGWLHHTPKRQRDMVLTGLGRAVLFGEVKDDLHTDMLVRPVPTVQPVQPVIQALPQVEVRRASQAFAQPAPQPVTAPIATPIAQTVDLSTVDTVDLLLELQSRGLKVSR